MAKARLTALKVNEISLVDAPAVPKATFLIAKRQTPEPEMTLEAVEKRIAPQGYTGSTAGATSPAHVHNYSLWLDVEDGVVRVRGWVDECCDHTHRVTLEGYLRGELESSDGHTHALMTIKEARALMAKGTPVADDPEESLTPEEASRLADIVARLGAVSKQRPHQTDSPVAPVRCGCGNRLCDMAEHIEKGTATVVLKCRSCKVLTRIQITR